MNHMPFSRIGIVGLGLIGGSIALGVRERWPHVRLMAVDSDAVARQALQRGLVDAASDRLATVADAELIVLAAPVSQNLGLLERLPSAVGGDAVITDTGSTKRGIVEAAKHLPARLIFVGGHPLGGAAAGGLDHARADLFAGRPWILTPEPGAESPAVARRSARAPARG